MSAEEPRHAEIERGSHWYERFAECRAVNKAVTQSLADSEARVAALADALREAYDQLTEQPEPNPGGARITLAAALAAAGVPE